MSDIYTNLLQDAVDRRKREEGYSLIYGVLDNDPKGLTGCGTIYYAKGLLAHKEVDIQWSLLDGIDKTPAYQAWDSFKTAYVNKCHSILKEEKARLKAEKEQKLNDRLDNVSVSDKTLAIIKATIQHEVELVNQYKQGKDKALNSLIGRIIKQVKSENISEEVFNITQVLKQEL
jgi:hypothetical protein